MMEKKVHLYLDKGIQYIQFYVFFYKIISYNTILFDCAYILLEITKILNILYMRTINNPEPILKFTI